MYIGAWQEYHLSKGSSKGKPRDDAGISMDEMRRALLLSLDADTTRRAMAAIELSRGTEITENSKKQKINRLILQKPLNKPLIRKTAKLPPLLVLQNSSNQVSLYNPNTNCASSYSGSLSTYQPLSSSILSDSSDGYTGSYAREYQQSQTNSYFNQSDQRLQDYKYLTLKSSGMTSLEPLGSLRSTVSEPVQPTRSSALSFQRSKAPVSNGEIDKELNTISKSYDSEAVLGILRATRKPNKTKYKDFFGAYEGNNKVKKEGIVQRTEIEKRIDDVKKMQNVYKLNEDVSRNNGTPSLPSSSYLPKPKTPYVADIDITDQELATISKYFNSDNIPTSSNDMESASTYYSMDSAINNGNDYLDDGLLHWYSELDDSALI